MADKTDINPSEYDDGTMPINLLKLFMDVNASMREKVVRLISLALPEPHQLRAAQEEIDEYSGKLLRDARILMEQNLFITKCSCLASIEKHKVTDRKKITMMLQACDKCGGVGYRNLLQAKIHHKKKPDGE